MTQTLLLKNQITFLWYIEVGKVTKNHYNKHLIGNTTLEMLLFPVVALQLEGCN